MAVEVDSVLCFSHDPEAVDSVMCCSPDDGESTTLLKSSGGDSPWAASHASHKTRCGRTGCLPRLGALATLPLRDCLSSRHAGAEEPDLEGYRRGWDSDWVMMGEASRGCLVDAEGAEPGQGAAPGTLAGGTIHALSDCLPATGAPAPVKSSSIAANGIKARDEPSSPLIQRCQPQHSGGFKRLCSLEELSKMTFERCSSCPQSQSCTEATLVLSDRLNDTLMRLPAEAPSSANRISPMLAQLLGARMHESTTVCRTSLPLAGFTRVKSTPSLLPPSPSYLCPVPRTADGGRCTLPRAYTD